MSWIRLARVHDVEEAFPLAVQAAGRPLAVFRIGALLFVTDDVCTHQRVPLTDGYFEDGCIECPLHQARFDVRTGRRTGGPDCADLRVYDIRIEDEALYAWCAP